MEPLDPLDVRIAHADRDKVAEVLRVAAGDGRIDLSELDERLEATYAAKTYGDLVPITLDLAAGEHLPAARPGAQPAPTRRINPAAPASYDASFAMMGDSKRVGEWTIGATHTATAVMGCVVLDLRRASFAAGEVVINANAVMGSVEVIVDAQTAVRVDGVGIMGSYTESRPRVPAEVGPDSPAVRVRGLALMGSVEVKRKGPPGELPGEPDRRLLGR